MKNIQFKFVLFTIFISIFFAFNYVAEGSWKPPDFLIGTWTGKSELFAPFKKGKYPSAYSEDWIRFKINILPDGSIDGKIGQAKLVNCLIKKNRGWFCRLFNIKSDYIICDGLLEGHINPKDTEKSRRFTVPFNIVNGKLKGGFLVLKKWQYPYPLFPRLNLEKN